MITRCTSIPGPCDRCSREAIAGELLCKACLNPTPQRSHPSISQQAWARLNRESLERRAYRTARRVERRAA